MKECNTCKEIKPYTEYYKHAKMSDGHLNICKACKRAQQIATRNNNLEYYQEYDRNRPNKEERARSVAEYQQTEKGKEVKQKSAIKYKATFPIKRKAVNAVNNAVRDGKLIKPSVCECCTNTFKSLQIHGHHSDYLKPLDVMWLCNKCHEDWHLHNKPINGDKGLF